MTWTSTPTRTQPRTLLLASVVVASSGGCDPSAGAGRVRTTFDVVVHGDGPGQALTTNGGDVVSLQRAELSLGGLSFFEGDALFASARRPRLVDELLSFSAAHAHPGHYTPGEALADMPQIGVVDLLASEPVVVGAEGLTGPYGSAMIPLTTDLDGGFTVALAGDVVLAGGGSRTFTAAVASAQEVDGVPCAVTVDGGSMDVSIALGELVRRIDFAGAAEVDGVDSIDLAAVAQAKNAIERELAAQNTYSLTYTEGP